MKIAFFWTWEFSKNIMKWILNDHDIKIALAVSQPDKPVWRKKTLTPTPVKYYAEQHSIPVLQPDKLRNNTEFFDALKNFELDFIVVVAYWKIVPNEVLEAPKYGCINIHGSILPAYRWASPIQESIKNWDTETWLTIMYMSEGMDEWDILKIENIKIDILDKTQDIFNKFEAIWPNLLVKTLEWILEWSIKWKKQDDSKASYCSKISKEDWEIDFINDNWIDIYNKFKAYNPWPWIYSYYNNKKISIDDCLFKNQIIPKINPWTVLKMENKDIIITCNDWILILKQIKLEWKKSMDINSFINGNKDFLNYKF